MVALAPRRAAPQGELKQLVASPLLSACCRLAEKLAEQRCSPQQRSAGLEPPCSATPRS